MHRLIILICSPLDSVISLNSSLFFGSLYGNIYFYIQNTERNTMSLSIDQLRPLVLNVGRAVHNADWNWQHVNSPFMRMYYVTEGTARVKLPSGVQVLRPGYLYWIPAFTNHSYICDSYFCHYYIHIYEEPCPDGDMLDEWDFPVEIPACEIDLALMKRLCAINPHMVLPQSNPAAYDNDSILMQNLLRNKQRAWCDKVESRGIVFQLLSRFIKQAQYKAKVDDDRIGHALHYIRKHIYEDIDLDTLANIACLSKSHFIRLFKKEWGVTPQKYITQKKIERAQLILATDDVPVKGIANMLAFEDYSYFNRVFKKQTGKTPLEYRNSFFRPYVE